MAASLMCSFPAVRSGPPVGRAMLAVMATYTLNLVFKVHTSDELELRERAMHAVLGEADSLTIGVPDQGTAAELFDDPASAITNLVPDDLFASFAQQLTEAFDGLASFQPSNRNTVPEGPSLLQGPPFG